MKRLLSVVLALACLQSVDAIPSLTPAEVDRKTDSLVSIMTLDEKLEVARGWGWGGRRRDGAMGAMEKYNLQGLRMSDGPVGVTWENRGGFTCFPASATIAATFDTTLVRKVGEALGQELKARGGNQLLGPCINIHRVPVGGRNFESFGEDPFLAARCAVSYVRGVQSQNVVATAKHYCCNNQEWSRASVNAMVSERALREIYFPAFEAAITEAGCWSVMSALNKINGTWGSENKYTLTDVLKKDWGFRGYVVSDAGGTHNGVKSINAGHETASPGEFYSTDTIKQALEKGLISKERIDDWARRMLRPKIALGLLGRPVVDSSYSIDIHKSLAREVAERGIVLLQNRDNVLPLSTKKIHSLAVLGPSAAIARTGGWGSSFVKPTYAITPLQGLKERLGDSIKIVHELGVEHVPELWKQITASSIQAPAGGKKGHWKGEYFNNLNLSGKPALVREDTTIVFDWGEKSPDKSIKADSFSIRWTADLSVDSSRVYNFTGWADDGLRFSINDSSLINVWVVQGPTSHAASMFLEKGKKYRLKVEYNDVHLGASIKLLWDWPLPAIDIARFNAAIAAAKACDAAVLFLGSSDSIEGEDHDRSELTLPGFQATLARAVAAVNPRTIVVINGGTPVVLKPWADSVKALVQAFFLGQETGSSLARVLCGDVNPSGKMPFSYITGPEQSPAMEHYRNQDITAPHSEGIYVGYRWLEKNKLTPSFPFGHGLSYTTFAYSKPTATKRGRYDWDIAATIKNSGARAGVEVVQAYVSDPVCSADRPAKELKGFAPVKLSPGESKTVTIRLNERSFAFYDTTAAKWKVEPGDFNILLGSSSQDIRLTKAIKIE